MPHTAAGIASPLAANATPTACPHRRLPARRGDAGCSTRVPLAPGMNVTVGIRTGECGVVEILPAWRPVPMRPVRLGIFRALLPGYSSPHGGQHQPPAVIVAMMTAAVGLGASVPVDGKAEVKSKASGYLGEYFLARTPFQDPVCPVFTRNLNQFRKVPFDQCHPRLSERFPEFSRPTWEEISFDLDIAEDVVKDRYIGRKKRPDSAERAEEHWRMWLEGSTAIRAAGQARMWRTRIDLDGDGREETMVRMVPDVGIYPVKLETTGVFSCDYSRGVLHLMNDARPEIAARFNVGGFWSDIVHFSGNNRYYGVFWYPNGPAYQFIDIGATAGVILSILNWNGYLVTGGEHCLIDWVPTGQYRPLKQHRGK